MSSSTTMDVDSSNINNNNNTCSSSSPYGGESLQARQVHLVQLLAVQIMQLVAKNNAENPNNTANDVMIRLLRQLIEQSMPNLDPGRNSTGIAPMQVSESSTSQPLTGTSPQQFHQAPTPAHGIQQLQSTNLMQQPMYSQPQQQQVGNDLVASLGQLLAAQQQGPPSGAGGGSQSNQTNPFNCQGQTSASFQPPPQHVQQPQSSWGSNQQQQEPNTNNLASNVFGQVTQQQQQAPNQEAVNALLNLLQNAGVQNGQGFVAANPNAFPAVAQQQQHEIREVNVPMVYPMSDIEFPGPHDVVLGRGRGASGHIGNVKFRAFIKKYKPKYAAANRIDKPKVAEEVVSKWRVKNPPGRFLEQVRTTDRNVWNDVGDRKARQKTSQSLREKELTRNDHRRNRDTNAEVSGDSSSVESGGSSESEAEDCKSTGSSGQDRSSTGSSGQERSSNESSAQEQATQKTARVSVESSGGSAAESERT